ncbi:MAG: tetratricopeptide repeat protein [Bacteroidia bacterium]|nr:tetratricopeptide repeat protein [Bacteroidia bacterium]
MRNKTSLLILLFFLFEIGLAQNFKDKDSLLLVLKTAKNDTNKVKTLHRLTWSILMNNPKEAIIYAREGYTLASELNQDLFKARALNNIGTCLLYSGDFSSAKDTFLLALKIKEKINNKKELSFTINNLGIVYLYLGDLEQSLNYYLKALKIAEELNDKDGMSMTLNNIAMVYENRNDYKNALHYFQEALKYSILIKNTSRIAAGYNNIGIQYRLLGEYGKALSYLYRAIPIQLEIKDNKSLSHTYSNLGEIYMKINQLDSASYFSHKAYELRKEIGDNYGISETLLNIGNIYYLKKDYLNAEKNTLRSASISDSIKFIKNLISCYYNLGKIYNDIGKYKDAAYYFEKTFALKDTLYNEQSSKQIEEMNIRYETEKKDKELILKDAEIAIQQSESKQKGLQMKALIVVLCMILIFVVFILRSYKQKKRANEIISQQKNEVELQKEIIEEKQKEILDSIHYAKRIQQSILPNENYISRSIKKLNKKS